MELMEPMRAFQTQRVDRFRQGLEAIRKSLAASVDQAVARANATLALLRNPEIQAAAETNPVLKERLNQIGEKTQLLLQEIEAKRVLQEESIARMQDDLTRFASKIASSS